MRIIVYRKRDVKKHMTWIASPCEQWKAKRNGDIFNVQAPYILTEAYMLSEISVGSGFSRLLYSRCEVK